MALAGKAPVPFEWRLSQTCETFGCAIVEGGALAQPVRLVEDILIMRSYVRARELVQSKHYDEAGAWGGLVLSVQAERVRIAARA